MKTNDLQQKKNEKYHFQYFYIIYRQADYDAKIVIVTLFDL